MRRVLVFFLTALALVSCSPRHFEPVQRDSVYVSRVDSIMVVDSVYIDRIRTIREKADTVYVTDWKTEYKFKYLDRVKIDTCYLDKVRTETVIKERDLTRWQDFRLKAFWWMLGVITLFVIWKLGKKRLPLR